MPVVCVNSGASSASTWRVAMDEMPRMASGEADLAATGDGEDEGEDIGNEAVSMRKL
jgi:hypothetical protein